MIRVPFKNAPEAAERHGRNRAASCQPMRSAGEEGGPGAATAVPACTSGTATALPTIWVHSSHGKNTFHPWLWRL